MKRNRIRDSRRDRLFDLVNNLILAALLLIFIYPLIFIVSASLSSGPALVANRVWLLPVDFTLEGYKAVLDYKPVLIGFKNSLIYLAVGTSINLVMTVIAAYPLSRRDFRHRKAIMLFFIFTMLFNAGMIPNYMLVRNLGMKNTVWAMVIPGAISVYNVIITKTYLQTNIPDSLLEASQLDGCSDFRFLTGVVLPLSAPIIAVMCLFYAVGHWNSFFNAVLYLEKMEMYPLQLILRQILIMNTLDASMMGTITASDAARYEIREPLKYALIVVSTIPVMFFYPFVQRYFVKGVMIGSIKE